MINYLNNKPQLFTLLTVISFLLVYVSGEKTGAFVFMLLIMYPLLIADGSFSILPFNLNPFLAISIDIFFLILLYGTIYCLIRSSGRSGYQRIHDKYRLFSLLILYVFVGNIFHSSINDGFSTVTIVVFLLLSFITLLIVISRLMNNKQKLTD